MAFVQDLLAAKGFDVHIISSSATVLEATCAMTDQRVGALVVMDEGQIVGMFTERDVLRRVVAARRDPQFTYVCEFMTRDVITVGPMTELSHASSIMKCHRVRHLPVVNDEGDLLGIVSMRDLHPYTDSLPYGSFISFEHTEALLVTGA
jgi:CBS domain-containing protein